MLNLRFESNIHTNIHTYIHTDRGFLGCLEILSDLITETPMEDSKRRRNLPTFKTDVEGNIILEKVD